MLQTDLKKKLYRKNNTHTRRLLMQKVKNVFYDDNNKLITFFLNIYRSNKLKSLANNSYITNAWHNSRLNAGK